MDSRRRLSLRPKTPMRAGFTPADDQPTYEVAGLSTDLAIDIAGWDGAWQIRVWRDGEAGEWQGAFETADAALAAIERELAKVDPAPRP